LSFFEKISDKIVEGFQLKNISKLTISGKSQLCRGISDSEDGTQASITNSNRARFAKLLTRGVQEATNGIAFSKLSQMIPYRKVPSCAYKSSTTLYLIH
jgi:hypothetical protein